MQHALASVFIVAAVLQSCCDDKVEQNEQSPSGDKRAKVTYRNCGVLADGTSITLSGAGSSDEQLVVSAKGHHAFIALWKDNQTLKVFVPATAKAGTFADPQIVHKNDEVNGTHIEYW
jgi:hypothetical protein